MLAPDGSGDVVARPEWLGASAARTSDRRAHRTRRVPQVLSYDAKEAWSQQRLIPYQDELRAKIRVPHEATGWSIQLDARFPQADLSWGRNLDDLLDPVAAALGVGHFVAIWGTRSEGARSSVVAGPAGELDADGLGDWYHTRVHTASFTNWLTLVPERLVGRMPLPGTGPVELIVAITVGPGRAWKNMWKPAVDVLGPILGRGSSGPRDDRIVRLGITHAFDPTAGHGITVDYWWRASIDPTAPIVSAPRRVLGVDAFSAGWVGVALCDGRFDGVFAAASLSEVIAHTEGAIVIGIDIPIGFAATGGRPADAQARTLLGPRASSVFPTPPRAALTASSYEEANVVARRLTGAGVSQQSWAIRSRILEAEVMAATDARFIEVHPEVSFRAMCGKPLQWAKTSWNGAALRRSALASSGIELPDDLGPTGIVAPADILDAAAAAWSADRMLTGDARPLPDPPAEHGGRAVAIWY